MKKALLGSLAVTLLLSGCSDNNSSTKPAETGTVAPSSKKLTLNWFIVADSNAQLPSVDKDFVKKAIEQKFNVELKLQHMNFTTDYQSKVNLLITSSQSPDMFFMGGRESNQYVLDKVAADMSKYVNPEVMPNYFKYWTNPTELKQYQVHGAFARAPVPFARTQYASYYIRKDWLDKLNLKVPENYNQMIEVMKAFTSGDPDGNGKNDTYGLSAAGNGANFVRDFPAWYEYGRPAGFVLEGDKFIDSASDMKVQNILEDTKKLLGMKVVDPDWYLNKTGQNIEKAAQGKVGIIWSANRDIAFENSPNSVQKKTIDVTGVKTADWQPFHPWANTGVGSEAVPGIPFLFSAKAPEENIQRTAKIMDWLFGEEGFLLSKYGQEGVHYKKEGSKITLISDAYKKDIIDNGNFLKIYGAFTPDEPFIMKLDVINPNETDRDRKIVDKVETYTYIPSPGTSLTPPQGFDLAAFRAKMNAYHAKILFEEKDASNWPKYREELINKYHGKEIFENYAKQVSDALGKTYTYVSANP